jgi:hypothetical protein
MAKFRKKPVVIEAVQFDGSRGVVTDIEGLCYCATTEVGNPHIHTLEGAHHVSHGDWVITGVKGERYPCKPDIFAATYEALENDAGSK